jgi:hypothetical protein
VSTRDRWFVSAAAAFVAGCAGFTNVVDDADGGVSAACEPAPCQGRALSCGNCEDDDGDGLVDALDPDCLGPCDDNEEGYYIEAGASPPSTCGRDCYFDQDQGAGNDRCVWDLGCDPLQPGGPGCPHVEPPVGGGCPAEQEPACLELCLPLVPNGCDCFGCCELVAGSGQYAFIGSLGDDRDPSCAHGLASDPAACRPCTPVDDCFNPCEECEQCVGRPASEVPGGCEQDCAGRAPCGLSGQPPCQAGSFCITGCCTYFG